MWIRVVALALLTHLGPFDALAQTNVWDHHMQAAMAAHRRAAFYEAEKRLGAALQEAERFAEGDPRLAQTLMAMGAVQFELNRYTEAEAHLQRALQLRQQALGPNHRRVAITLNALGLVRSRGGRQNEAVPLFRQALQAIDKSGDGEDGLTGQILGNLAGVLVAEGHYDEAEPHYRRQIALLQETLGERHPDTAEAMESYAVLLRLTGRDEAATELEKKVDEILKR